MPALALLLSGCGLETVEYLPVPPVSSYLNQSQYDSLTLSQSSSYYSETSNFQGYEVYYKIYPAATVVSANLASDVSRLSTTPTRDYLVALGYQRMNAANENSTTVPLIRLNYNTGTTVSLDFSILTGIQPGNIPVNLGQVGSPVPQVTFGNGGSAVPLFRTVTGGNVTYPYFNQLFSNWLARDSDMDSTVQLTSSPYEIDIFIVAYAFTLEKTTYSQPVPWGVLRDLKVPR